jgi:hypothetical protein
MEAGVITFAVELDQFGFEVGAYGAHDLSTRLRTASVKGPTGSWG